MLLLVQSNFCVCIKFKIYTLNSFPNSNISVKCFHNSKYNGAGLSLFQFILFIDKDNKLYTFRIEKNSNLVRRINKHQLKAFFLFALYVYMFIVTYSFLCSCQNCIPRLLCRHWTCSKLGRQNMDHIVQHRFHKETSCVAPWPRSRSCPMVS